MITIIFMASIVGVLVCSYEMALAKKKSYDKYKTRVNA